MFSLEARATFLRDLAEDKGVLVLVAKDEARNWRMEWQRILRVVGRRTQPAPSCLPFTQFLARVARKGRSRPLPPAMAIPGTWLLFKPHASHPVPPHLYQVVAVIPAGVPLRTVLSADQLAAMDRHTSMDATPRCIRVLVQQTGSRRQVGCFKAILAGELAARATVMGQAPRVMECGRLPDPLTPDTFVAWDWHSRHGVAHLQGLVVGYVPADVPILKACPSFQMTWGLRAISNEDRYLVRALRGKKPVLSPAAHLIEQAFLNLEAKLYGEVE